MHSIKNPRVLEFAPKSDELNLEEPGQPIDGVEEGAGEPLLPHRVGSIHAQRHAAGAKQAQQLVG